MSPGPLVAVGLVGLVAGALAGGAVGLFEDTKTETATSVVTQVDTTTKTVRRGGSAAAGAPKTVTRTQTVTTSGGGYVPPGETPSGGSGKATTVEGTRTFTGKDLKQIGTLKVKQRSTMEWTNSGQVFSVLSQSQLHVSSTKKKGSVRLFEGTYYQFRVAAVGRWKLTIKPRS